MRRSECGYAMAALLVAMGVMSVVLSMALPAWRTATKREKEAELMFRGQQYAHAIALFQRKYAGAFPPNVDMLVQQKFLRRKYKDPVTNDDFQIVPVGAAGTPTPQTGRGGQPAAQPGVPSAAAAMGAALGELAGRTGGVPTTTGMLGVVSKSTETSLRLFNGRNHYNEWVFVATQASTAAGAPAGTGTQMPGGVPGRGGPQDGRGGQRGQGGQRGGVEGQPGGAPFGGRPGFPPPAGPGGQQQPQPGQFPGRGRL